MAQKYRKVDPRVWTDERFTRLPLEGKILALWMLTGGRVNRCGIVQWSTGLASEETGIPFKVVDTVLDTVCDTLNWVRDEVSKTVFLTRWWRYNRPDNPSALAGALSDLHDLPRNSLKPYLVKASVDLNDALRPAYLTVLDTVYDTVGDTVSPQEQEQEQEQEQDFSPVEATAKKERKPRARDALFDAIADVTGSDPGTTGSHIGKTRAALLKGEPPFTPDEVRDFASRFLELCPWSEGRRPTLGEVQKYINLVRAGQGKKVSRKPLFETQDDRNIRDMEDALNFAKEQERERPGPDPRRLGRAQEPAATTAD